MGPREPVEQSALRAAREELADVHRSVDFAGIPRGALVVRVSVLREQRDEARAEVDRLRHGLQQIVEGDYPADALDAETWAAEVLADSHAVRWTEHEIEVNDA